MKNISKRFYQKVDKVLSEYAYSESSPFGELSMGVHYRGMEHGKFLVYSQWVDNGGCTHTRRYDRRATVELAKKMAIHGAAYGLGCDNGGSYDIAKIIERELPNALFNLELN